MRCCRHWKFWRHQFQGPGPVHPTTLKDLANPHCAIQSLASIARTVHHALFTGNKDSNKMNLQAVAQSAWPEGVNGRPPADESPAEKPVTLFWAAVISLWTFVYLKYATDTRKPGDRHLGGPTHEGGLCWPQENISQGLAWPPAVETQGALWRGLLLCWIRAFCTGRSLSIRADPLVSVNSTWHLAKFEDSVHNFHC